MSQLVVGILLIALSTFLTAKSQMVSTGLTNAAESEARLLKRAPFVVVVYSLFVLGAVIYVIMVVDVPPVWRIYMLLLAALFVVRFRYVIDQTTRTSQLLSHSLARYTWLRTSVFLLPGLFGVVLVVGSILKLRDE